MQEFRKEREEKLTNKVNKVTLLLRVLVSVYVLYLAYGLIKDYGTAENPTLSLVAIVIFVIGGGLILISSGYKLAKGDYDDGSGEQEQTSEDEETIKDGQTADETNVKKSELSE
jgi:hypothetical protein